MAAKKTLCSIYTDTGVPQRSDKRRQTSAPHGWSTKYFVISAQQNNRSGKRIAAVSFGCSYTDSL